jgi:diguanylate cyclase (GGDEF)-like protein
MTANLDTDGRALSEALAAVRRGLMQHDTVQVLGDLERLEAAIGERLRDLQAQADAAADATVRSVELAVRMDRLADELRRQNLDLLVQNERIDAARRELEAQARATAEAAVDAVMLAEESRERARRLESLQAEAEAANRSLKGRARDLEVQLQATAEANVDAVLAVEQHEATAAEMARRAQAAEQEREALADKAFLDDLTGLFNVRYCREQFRHELARARRYKRPLSVVFLDVDHFKAVNDTHGHAIGDMVLRAVAAIVRAEIRTADIPMRVPRESEPLAARYGGEEFLILLPETEVQGGREIAERVRKSVETASIGIGPDGPTIRITLSGGVAQLSDDDQIAADLLGRADAAMYRGKHMGRNRIETAP